MKKLEQKDREFMKGLYTLATVGLNLVAATFIGLLMGWLIDHKLFGGKTEPWFTMIFLIFGIIAGFRNIFRMVKSSGGSEEGEDDGGSG